MMNKKRKGFTFLETVISLSFVAMILSMVIYIPTQMVTQYKKLEDKISYTEAVINVYQAFSKDISNEHSPVIAQEDILKLGDVKYTFSEYGVNRNNSSNLKITKIPVSYFVDNDEMTINIPNEKGNDITLKYNLSFSSFPNGGSE